MPSLASGETVWSVITPSMSTVVWPLTVTAITTRTRGIDKPAPTRNRVCSGDWVLILNTSSNPLVPVALLITFTESRALMTSRGTGTGSMGPIIRVRLTPLKLAIRSPGRRRAG